MYNRLPPPGSLLFRTFYRENFVFSDDHLSKEGRAHAERLLQCEQFPVVYISPYP